MGGAHIAPSVPDRGVSPLTSSYKWPAMRNSCFSILYGDQNQPRSTLTLLSAPALEAVEYLDIKFNGSVYHQSIYKGQPNPELDAAWDKLVFRSESVRRRKAAQILMEYTIAKPTPISSEILHKLKKSNSPSLVKFLDEDGGGYHTTLELTHEIHCLVCPCHRTRLDGQDSLFS